jgi:Phytanoyl-CoA dioxygenase (PhyH)
MLGCQRRSFAADVECVEAILRRWDPIGVFPEWDCCPTRDEYDSYAPHLLSMVCQGAGTGAITDELQRIRTGSIGMPANFDADAMCARQLMALGSEADDFDQRGFQFVKNVLTSAECDELIAALPTLMRRAGGQRSMLDIAAVADLVRSPRISTLLASFRAIDFVAISAKLFDKTPQANWKVSWHQDRVVPVADRIDEPGFENWSVKAGVLHVTPPGHVLEQILSVRLHLDDASVDNGPLRVIAGTHRLGVLHESEIKTISNGYGAAVVPASRGDGIVFRPLLLHASSSSPRPQNRRVLHIEFAPRASIAPAKWAAVAPQPAG